MTVPHRYDRTTRVHLAAGPLSATAAAPQVPALCARHAPEPGGVSWFTSLFLRDTGV
jgi:hypothetical protein